MFVLYIPLTFHTAFLHSEHSTNYLNALASAFPTPMSPLFDNLHCLHIRFYCYTVSACYNLLKEICCDFGFHSQLSSVVNVNWKSNVIFFTSYFMRYLWFFHSSQLLSLHGYALCFS